MKTTGTLTIKADGAADLLSGRGELRQG